MVPGVVLGIAGHPSRHPFLIDVVIGVPLVAPGDSAFVAPNEAFSESRAHKLVDVKLQGLRIREIRSVKVDVVDEVMSAV